jgi:drug/metabolite transporter (DMT)-like permease
VVSVLGGLAASVIWGLTAIAATRSSRLIGTLSTASWAILIGLGAVAPLLLFAGAPGGERADWGWAVVGGLGTIGGMTMYYGALRRGTVALVGPVSASQGAIAAIIAVIAFGEDLQPLAVVGLAMVTAGTLVVARSTQGDDADARSDRVALMLALGASTAFAVGLIAGAEGGDSLGPLWLLAGSRLTSAVLLVAPVAALGRVRSPRPALVAVVACGVGEVTALGCFVYGASHGSTAVAAVLGSLYPVVGVLLGVVMLDQRPRRVQIVGGLAILAGVTLLAAVQS